jgi:bifunctional DNA-binding transcriptional regulator/antitoxin component of YhaV-PrlF toxin-antitoxin module
MRRCSITTLSAKGQVTIPVRCLAEWGWVKGRTKLRRSSVRGAAVIAPVKDSGPGSSRGSTR